jgi:hypothetical protein
MEIYSIIAMKIFEPCALKILDATCPLLAKALAGLVATGDNPHAEFLIFHSCSRFILYR